MGPWAIPAHDWSGSCAILGPGLNPDGFLLAVPGGRQSLTRRVTPSFFGNKEATCREAIIGLIAKTCHMTTTQLDEGEPCRYGHFCQV